MKKILVLGLILGVVLATVGMATAYGENGENGRNGNEYAYDQEDGPLRDGSCQDIESSNTVLLLNLHNGPQFHGYGGDCPC